MKRTGFAKLVGGALCGLVAGGLWSQAEGLTIYRIGGESLPPPPEVQRGEADFRQLSWAPVEPQSGGAHETLSIDAEGIAPLFFGPEDNIAPTITARGGFLKTEVHQAYTSTEETDQVMDGDPETFFEETSSFREGGYQIGSDRLVGKAFFFDLGGLFAVDGVRLYPRAGIEGRIAEHVVVAANIAEAPEEVSVNLYLPFPFQRMIRRYTGLIFDVIAQIEENQKSLIELKLPKKLIRRLTVWVAPQSEIWEIAELEIFAAGYVPQASYQSNIIDLGTFSSLGWVRWSGRRDPEARVALRSQSGDDGDPQVYWRRTLRGDEEVTYGTAGATLTWQDYQKLEAAEVGAITHDSENWELWSAPYDFADSLGVPLGVKKPHRYLQFRVDFTSPFPFRDGGRVRFVEFATSSPPAAANLVAEIDPWQVETSQVTSFTYAMRPTIEPGDRGFDSVELRAPGARVAAVDEVRIGGREVAFEDVEVEEERLVVSFPRMDFNQTGELLEVMFRGEVFRFGTTFAGRVFDSEAPAEVWQTIGSGDATERLDGNSVSVQTRSLAGSVLGALEVGGGVCTPDGDGINDVVGISYDLVKLTSPARVRVRVWDLAGRLVREVYAGEDGAGRHVRVWEGVDAGGQQVGPGLYICQVEVETTEEQQVQSKLLAVVY